MPILLAQMPRNWNRHHCKLDKYKSLGIGAAAKANGAVALGTSTLFPEKCFAFELSTKKLPAYSIAIGTKSNAISPANGVALEAKPKKSIALGFGNRYNAIASNAIAIGTESEALIQALHWPESQNRGQVFLCPR